MGNKISVNKGIPKMRRVRRGAYEEVPNFTPNNSGNKNYSAVLIGIVVVVIIALMLIVL